jgi:nicotinate-nucleotide pyrophosphorylase
MLPDPVRRIIATALEEDIGPGDITTDNLISSRCPRAGGHSRQGTAFAGRRDIRPLKCSGCWIRMPFSLSVP